MDSLIHHDSPLLGFFLPSQPTTSNTHRFSTRQLLAVPPSLPLFVKAWSSSFCRPPAVAKPSQRKSSTGIAIHARRQSVGPSPPKKIVNNKKTDSERTQNTQLSEKKLSSPSSPLLRRRGTVLGAHLLLASPAMPVKASSPM